MEWQRPKTTRRYLHPPKAERMFTLWREGKIIFGEVESPVNKPYGDIISQGVWFTVDGEQLDFKKAENTIREDGIPVHGLRFPLGDIDLELESFSGFERKPTCYIKATLTNTSEKDAKAKFGFMLRRGVEQTLVFDAPDVYVSYDPDIRVWKNLPESFKKQEKTYRDGEIFFTSDKEFEYNDGEYSFEATLGAGKKDEFIFSFGKGVAEPFDYKTELEKTLKAWKNELKRINKLPEIGEENEKTVRNLAVQLMQCFCHTTTAEELYARQGGLQREVWPMESMTVLDSLSRIGDFDDYIEPVLDTYFTLFKTDSGEMKPFGCGWAMVTANILYSFANYSLQKDKKFYEKYADEAYRSFLWIKNTRVKQDGIDEAGYREAKGLFPSMQCSDDPLKFQAWSFTDIYNIIGLSSLASAAEKHGDSRAAEIRAEHTDYLATIKREWARYIADNDFDELKVPYSPAVPDEVIYPNYEFGSFVCTFVDGVDVPLSDFERIDNYYRRRGVFRDGLYYRMADKKNDYTCRENLDENGKCVVWYVCHDEYRMFKYLMRHGMRERAEEIIKANSRFAMTDEYYMCERYNQKNPWFAPWSPNASASGRTINMILDFYS